MNKSMLNDVKNRFISLPKSATLGLEHEPKKSDFNIIKELGMGSYGTVYLVSHKKTKAKYALKAIDKTVPENLEEKAAFNREVEIMYKLNHPNIVKLYGHFEDDKYCYFIMEYIPNHSLYSIIPTPGQRPNLRLIASVMKDLLSAVYYLHNMKPTIIHRDIKPENVLLDNNHKAYLTDFGWSNYMPTFTRRTTVCGTPLYLPPEMIEDRGHDETADLWCFGVVLFELVTGYTPFKGENVETVSNNIKKLNISWIPNMDPDAKDLISKVLKLNGKDRLPIEKILAHKFFSQFFPNAVKELIKPAPHEVPTFVVSIDDPKDYGKQKDRNNANNTNTQKRNNTAQPPNTQLGHNVTLRGNNNNINRNININRTIRINTSNYNRSGMNNPSSINTNNKINVRSSYILPRANIDLSNKRNERNNISGNNNPYKRKNSYKINSSVNTNLNRNVTTINTRLNSNPNRYNLRNTTTYNIKTNPRTYNYVNSNLGHINTINITRQSYRPRNFGQNNTTYTSSAYNTINNNNVHHRIRSNIMTKPGNKGFNTNFKPRF